MLPPRANVAMARITDDGREIHIQVDVLHYATDILTPQLKDPLKPRCCPQCVALCVATLSTPDCSQMLSYLLLKKHDFFAACLAVLAAPRRDADIPALRAQLKDNRLRCPNTEWHGFLHPQSVDDPLALFLTVLITCVSSAIRNVKSKGWFRAKAREGTWPTAPEQLLPYGDRASVASYVFWCHTLLSPYAVPLLVGLLEVARSTVLPHLLAPPQKDFLMRALVAMLSDRNACGPLLTSAMAASVGPSDGLLPQQTAAGLMSVIHNGQGALLTDLTTLYTGHERALYPALISVLDSDIIRDETVLLSLCSIATHCHERLSLPQSALHERLIWYKNKLNLPNGLDGVIQLVFMVLYHQSRSKSCSAAGCHETGTQTCARCKIVRYCGRACQQKDWKVPQGAAFDVSVTHKAVCPILCRLRDAGVSVEGKMLPQFTAAFQHAGIPDSDYQEVISWGAVAGLIPLSVFADIGVAIARGSS